MVHENQLFYTKKQINDAKKARKYQALLGWSSSTTYENMIRKNQIINCDITVEDVSRELEIFGTPLLLLKGKMKRITPSAHPKTTRIMVPDKIFERHKDIRFVNLICHVLKQNR